MLLVSLTGIAHRLTITMGKYVVVKRRSWLNQFRLAILVSNGNRIVPKTHIRYSSMLFT